MTPKLKIPKGWRRVTSGYAKKGDRFRDGIDENFVDCFMTIGEPVSGFGTLIRRIPTPAKRAGKGRK